jgi:hypothetical protein
VIHYTAGSEGPTSAEDGASYDQRRTDGTSTHYFVDQNSVVQCVLTRDTAYSAFQYGNARGIQYELCGTAQSRAQWLDAASNATITNAARQIARDCAKWGIPAQRIGPSQMLAGQRGICGHVDVTNAYGLGDHTDPGPEFPWDVLIARVNDFLNGNDESEGDPMQIAVHPNSGGGKSWRIGDGVMSAVIRDWPQHQNLLEAGATEKEFNNVNDAMGYVGRIDADWIAGALNTLLTVTASIASKVDIDATELAAIQQAAQTGANQALAGAVAGLADQVVAALRQDLGENFSNQVETKVREIFADAATK